MNLHLLSYQTDMKDNEIDSMELFAKADLIRKDKFLMIDYDEYIEEADEPVKNRLRLYPDKITITRVGEYSSNMSFKVGDFNKSLYSTPFGDLPFVTETIDFKSDVDENAGGDIHLKYKITLGDNEPYYNIMKIKIS